MHRCTINGFLGTERPSFLQNTMRVIASLKASERMPVSNPYSSEH